MCVLARVRRLLLILAAATMCWLAASPAHAQFQRLPELSEIEPLTPDDEQPYYGYGQPAEGPHYGPPLDYFDQDGWLAPSGPTAQRGDWSWQILPDGLIYSAYLANPKESRLGTQLFSTSDGRFLWDSMLGGHMGLLRYGTTDTIWPQGWQFDVEGGAFVRLNPDVERDLEAADFRIGAPITYGYGRHRFKFSYYHLSSHVGDEFLLKNPGFVRQNFVRETFILGYSIYASDNLRLYAEAGWAFMFDVSRPWEFQFGLDWAPSRPTGIRGAPFFAVHGHLREELNFSGNLTVQTGWAWRGSKSGHLLRLGLHYYDGLSDQYSFYQVYEQQLGGGLWYDF